MKIIGLEKTTYQNKQTGVVSNYIYIYFEQNNNNSVYQNGLVVQNKRIAEDVFLSGMKDSKLDPNILDSVMDHDFMCSEVRTDKYQMVQQIFFFKR